MTETATQDEITLRTAESSIAIDYIRDTIVAPPGYEKQELLGSLSSLLDSRSPTVLVQLAFNSSDDVIAHLEAFAPENRSYVFILCVWNDPEVPGSVGYAERLMLHAATWALSMDRHTFHVETTKATRDFYRDRAFKILSTTRVLPIPEDFSSDTFSKGAPK